MDNYFQTIRENPEKLLDFFQKMPKGADIHHHAMGAIWVEDIIKKAIELNLWVDSRDATLFSAFKENTTPLKTLIEQEGSFEFCLEKWSVSGFYNKNTAHFHFFDIFPKIEAVFIGNEAYWLDKIVAQAEREKLLYVETLIECPTETENVRKLALQYQGNLDEFSTDADFEQFYSFIKTDKFKKSIENVISLTDSWVSSLGARYQCQLKFQLYTIRNLDPREVLALIILSYEAASLSDHIVGVNLVAPEYEENTLKYYSMQMRACRFLGTKFPNVNLALHAGELTEKIVPHEHLEFHIYEAISVAKAKRVGHGVDLLTEAKRNYILDIMSEKPIAIEILPDSNDFILQVSGAEHPFEAYHLSGVPVVVATDDPGILRCSLAEQFLKLALDNKYLQYSHFKIFAMNSIRYSFLPKDKKEQILLLLEKEFQIFEETVLE